MNRPSDIQRTLHRSHLLDSFPFVILWIHTLDGKVCVVSCSILRVFGLGILPMFSSTILPVSPCTLPPEEPVRCIGYRDWPFLVVPKRAVLVNSLSFPGFVTFLESFPFLCVVCFLHHFSSPIFQARKSWIYHTFCRIRFRTE